MSLLTIKDSFGSSMSYNARVMLGTPPEMGTLYVLLGNNSVDDGKPHPQSLEITEGKTKHFVIFDCIEVVGSVAYGYGYVTRQRQRKIGDFVSFA